MKKLFYITGLALCMALTACGDDDESDSVDCVALINAISPASQKYADDQTTENCEAYQKSIRDVLNNGCSDDDAAAKAQLEAILDAFDCGS